MEPASGVQPATHESASVASLEAVGDGRRPLVQRLRSWRPSSFIGALAAIAAAVAFVGGLTYYGAREFSGRAADTRASEEAASLAQLSAYTATGDAFNGYLQILRYADDPVVNSPQATTEQRVAAMQQLLYLNTNKLGSLAIVTRQGIVLATTDPSISDVRDSEAFKVTRANLGPTNSDIMLPEGEARGYVEFTAPLKDREGTVWAILYGRADPDLLWQQTVRASVDGSRNVIINNAGQFSAGVPEDMLRQPWKGVPLANGSVRADIVGVDSICGLGPVGRDTQIDHGWNVASCLPASLIQVEASRAMGQQGLVTLAGCVLAVVLAAGVLRIVIPGGGPGADDAEDTPWEARVNAAIAGAHAVAVETQVQEPEPPPLETTREIAPAPELIVDSDEPEADEGTGDEDPAELAPPIAEAIVGVDAVGIIDAYERRNARLSKRLRESIQARLLVAAAQAAEAYRLREEQPERADQLHASAMEELDALRDRELRLVGQEMHPGFIRLGLPGALSALRKEFEGKLGLTLDVDPLADGIGGTAGRVAIDNGRRTVLFRAAREALQALADAGALDATVTLTRDGDMLRLLIGTSALEGAVDEGSMSASALSAAAYGGTLRTASDGVSAAIVVDLLAPGVPVDDEPYVPTEWNDEDEPPWQVSPHAEPARPAGVVTFALADDESRPLGEYVRELALEMGGYIEVVSDIDPAFETANVIDPALAGSLRRLIGTAVRGLAAAEARGCVLWLQMLGDEVELRLSADPHGAFVGAPTSAAGEALEARGGSCEVRYADGSFSLVARVAVAPPAEVEDQPAVVQLQRTEPQDIEIEDDEPAA